MTLLIHPPAARPCEPPAGIARLSGFLKAHGIRHAAIDANLEGLLHLLKDPSAASSVEADTWTRRAFRNAESNVMALRDWRTYSDIDRYSRAVMDLGRALEKSSGGGGATVGLANFRHRELSPLRSADLIRAAERPALNPYHTYFSTRLEGLLIQQSPKVAGISVNYLSQALCAFAMAGWLRKAAPGLKIVLGGGLITSWLRRGLWADGAHPFGGLIDRMVAGPGEQAMLEISGYGTAPGISRASPSYEGLPPDSYLSPGHVLPYSASRGCPWNRCSFCPERMEKNPYEVVSPKAFIEDLSVLVRDSAPSLIHILDNSIGTSHIKALMAAPPGAPWYGFTRITEALCDEGFCEELRRSGCVMLKLGLESGDARVLESLNKGVDPATSSRALRALKRAGIATYVYLLFGTPPEDESAARNTLSFVRGHSGEIDFLNLAIFNMPLCAGSSGSADGHASATFYEGDLSLYADFRHPLGWDRKSVRRFLEDEFRKAPEVAPILRRTPPVFTSNHAPFFVMSRQ